MKTKFRIITCLFLVMLTGFSKMLAQENQEKKKKNEFTINAPYALNGFPEFSYNRILDEGSSIGISVGFSLEKGNEYKFAITPNYRVFFGNKRAAGFFIESHVAFFSKHEHEQTQLIIGSVNANNNVKKMGFGVGFAIGHKFLSKNGFIGEIYAGAGRNFMNTEIIGNGYPRLGVSIGKRF